MLHAPSLSDTSAEKQEDVDDILLVMNREGPKCVLYNLSFARMFDDWHGSTEKLNSLRFVV
jgi:hypothetical protein